MSIKFLFGKTKSDTFKDLNDESKTIACYKCDDSLISTSLDGLNESYMEKLKELFTNGKNINLSKILFSKFKFNSAAANTATISNIAASYKGVSAELINSDETYNFILTNAESTTFNNCKLKITSDMIGDKSACAKDVTVKITPNITADIEADQSQNFNNVDLNSKGLYITNITTVETTYGRGYIFYIKGTGIIKNDSKTVLTVDDKSQLYYNVNYNRFCLYGDSNTHGSALEVTINVTKNVSFNFSGSEFICSEQNYKIQITSEGTLQNSGAVKASNIMLTPRIEIL